MSSQSTRLRLGLLRQGRWKNERVAQSYIRPATIFVNNATDGLGDEPEKGKK